MAHQSAELEWRGEVPISTRFDDPYFSLDDGLAETRHVFLDGNDLPARYGPGFHIAELGFGTGLNFLTAWAAWEQSGQTGPLSFTSFEAFPLDLDAMARTHHAFPDLKARARSLRAIMRRPGPWDLGSARLTVIEGDARQSLPVWDGSANAWFLDGFSPAKNPQLWEPALLRAVADHTVPGGTAATYTAAGHVRRALEDAGFVVTRAPGYGRKRHMTRAHLP